MKPYYDDGEGIVIYHGDCLEVMPSLASVDAVITDPPYGVGFKYESHDDTRVGYKQWCDKWFAECRKLSGTIAISCGIANLQSWPQADWVLCWHKPASMGRCVVGFNNWEPVLLYGKARAGQIVDVFRACIVPDDSLDRHPCPKPLGWGHGVVRSVTKATDIILDPFMGSGTTLRAAKDLGRKAIGIEIEERYCEIAANRLAQGVLQF